MSRLVDSVAQIEPTFNLSLILATVWAIKNDYAKFTTSSLIIGQYATSQASNWYQSDLIENIVTRVTNRHHKHGAVDIKFLLEGDIPYNNEEGDEEEQHINKDYKERAIWFIDSLKAYNRLEADLLDPRKLYKRNGYFCIIYTGNEKERLENIKVIFHRLFDIYVININLFLNMGKSAFVYTYFPFARNKCHSSKPELYQSFRGIRENADFVINKHFFPSKVRNMYGCDLYVTTWDQPPYMIIDRNPETGKLQRLHGIEGMLLTVLAEEMNFTINIRPPPTNDRGYIYDNGTATGATKMIIEGETNITLVCYLSDKRRADYMLPATSYIYGALVLGIPKGSPMSPFERLIKPFKYIIWSCFSSSILCAIIVIFILKLVRNSNTAQFVFGHNNRTPLTNFWNTLYGGSIPGQLPKRNFARYLLTVWLLYTFVMRNAYTGELYTILQDARIRTTLQTIDEVVEKNYTIYTLPAVDPLLREVAKLQNIKYMDTKKNSMVNVIARLNDAGVKHVVTMLEFTAKAHNSKPVNAHNRIRVLPETLITAPITLFMRKNSYLKHQVNDLLLNMMSAGMVHKFEELYLGTGGDAPNAVSYVPTVLSISLLLGLFTVYGTKAWLIDPILVCLLWNGYIIAAGHFLNIIIPWTFDDIFNSFKIPAKPTTVDHLKRRWKRLPPYL